MQFKINSSQSLGVVQRFWELRNIPFYANAIYLITHKTSTAAISFLFWIGAARLLTPDEVGLSTAMISVAVLLAFFSRFGMGDGLIRFLPKYDGDASKLINSVFIITIVASVFASVVFLLGIPIWSPAMRAVQGQPILVSIFVISVVGAATSGLVESVFVACKKGNLILYYGTLLGLTRLAALGLAVSIAKPLGIFTAWGLPAVAAAGLALIVVLPILRRGYKPSVAFSSAPIKSIGPFSSTAFGSKAWNQIMISVLPILILNMAGSQNSAFFFASWTIGSRLFTIPTSISTSLFAEGSNDESDLIPSIKRSFRLTVTLLLPAVAFVVLAAKPILFLVGRPYMEQAHQVLWVIAISALPFAVNAIYLGVVRVEKKQLAIITVPGALCILTLSLAYMLVPHLGILGAGVGFLAAQTVVAAVLFPRLLTRITRSQIIHQVS